MQREFIAKCDKLGVRPTGKLIILKGIDMASLNKVMLIGSLGKDPEVNYTAAGQTVASFTIATTEKYKNKAGEQEERTEWHRIVAWGKLAEIVRDYVTKGKTVYIEGKLQTRKWQDQGGNDRYTTEIIADKLQMLSSPINKQAQAQPQSRYQTYNDGHNHDHAPFGDDNRIEDDVPF